MNGSPELLSLLCVRLCEISADIADSYAPSNVTFSTTVPQVTYVTFFHSLFFFLFFLSENSN